jgi:hypothetical protein
MRPAGSLAFGRRGRAAALLAAALTLHDLEEAVGYPLTRPKLLALWPAAPATAAFWAALAGVTVAGVLAALWAGSGAASGAKTAILRTIGWVLLVNVLAPHVPAAFVLGGYAPGAVTAVLVNVPVCIVALRLLRAP